MQPLLDIEKVVRTKAPKIYHKIPRFVFRFFAWLICQKEMNDTIIALDGFEGAEFAQKFCERQNIRFIIKGEENLPKEGRLLFVSNHPLGAFDGVCYISIFGKKYPKFKVLVNDILMNIEGLRPNFLPLNTLGKQKREDMQAISAAYHDDDTQILSFPAGFCSRFIGGRIQDIEWKPSTIKQAVENKRDIIPMYFKGRNSIAFYGLEWFRRVLGMKFNIGLILLPRQMMRTAKNQTYTITIGHPIPWETFLDKSKTTKQWTQWLKEECYSLS